MSKKPDMAAGLMKKRLSEAANAPNHLRTVQPDERAGTPAKPRTPPSRQDKKQLLLHVSPEAKKQFSLLAAEQEKTKQDLLIEALNLLFASYGKSEIA